MRIGILTFVRARWNWLLKLQIESEREKNVESESEIEIEGRELRFEIMPWWQWNGARAWDFMVPMRNKQRVKERGEEIVLFLDKS